MENRTKDNLVVLLSIILITVTGIFCIRLVFAYISEDQKQAKDTKAQNSINKKDYESLSTVTANEETVSADSQFGRENPFAPYK